MGPISILRIDFVPTSRDQVLISCRSPNLKRVRLGKDSMSLLVLPLISSDDAVSASNRLAGQIHGCLFTFLDISLNCSFQEIRDVRSPGAVAQSRCDIQTKILSVVSKDFIYH